MGKSNVTNTSDAYRSLYAERTAEDQHVSDLKTTLERTTKFYKILVREEQIKSQERLNRLASALRVEYQDYQDALTMDMSLTLGENLRDQLTEVFRILRKEGIEL